MGERVVPAAARASISESASNESAPPAAVLCFARSHRDPELPPFQPLHHAHDLLRPLVRSSGCEGQQPPRHLPHRGTQCAQHVQSAFSALLTNCAAACDWQQAGALRPDLELARVVGADYRAPQTADGRLHRLLQGFPRGRRYPKALDPSAVGEVQRCTRFRLPSAFSLSVLLLHLCTPS